jgi:hypothetical protein
MRGRGAGRTLSEAVGRVTSAVLQHTVWHVPCCEQPRPLLHASTSPAASSHVPSHVPCCMQPRPLLHAATSLLHAATSPAACSHVPCCMQPRPQPRPLLHAVTSPAACSHVPCCMQPRPCCITSPVASRPLLHHVPWFSSTRWVASMKLGRGCAHGGSLLQPRHRDRGVWGRWSYGDDGSSS